MNKSEAKALATYAGRYGHRVLPDGSIGGYVNHSIGWSCPQCGRLLKATWEGRMTPKAQYEELRQITINHLLSGCTDGLTVGTIHH